MDFAFDSKALVTQLGQIIGEELRAVVEAGQGDVKLLGRLIAQDLILTIKAGDSEWNDELIAQAKAVVELTRIRLNEASWQTLERTLKIVLKVTVAALAAAAAAA